MPKLADAVDSIVHSLTRAYTSSAKVSAADAERIEDTLFYVLMNSDKEAVLDLYKAILNA